MCLLAVNTFTRCTPLVLYCRRTNIINSDFSEAFARLEGGKEMFSITRVGIKCDRELQKVCVYLYYHPCRRILGRSTPHAVIYVYSYYRPFQLMSKCCRSDRNESRVVCRNGSSTVLRFIILFVYHRR